MSARLNKLQIGSFKTFGGTVATEQIDKYWLGHYLGCNTPSSDKFIRTLLDYRYGGGIESILSKYPTKEIDPEDKITWQVLGSNYRNIELKEARDFDGNVIDENYSGNVGIGVEPFYLVFGEYYFFDQEVIVGNLNEIYQFRILDEPREEGSDYVYKVELMGGNTTGVPAERLLPGERFSKEAAFVEPEFSRKAGNINFAVPVGMSQEWSTVRIYTKVGGDAINKKLKYAIQVPAEEGGQKKTINMWMSYVEMELNKQFKDYKNKALLFGRSNRTENGEFKNLGKSGYAIKTGAGLLEQISVSNTHYFNEPEEVLDLILEAVQEKAYSLDLNQREFIINTGTGLATVLSNHIADKVGLWKVFTFNGDNLGVVSKVKNAVHQNSLAAGFQFVEFRGPNGIVLKINVDRFYDDPVRNKINMPGTNTPAMSYRADIVYAGSEEEPNIVKCAIKGKQDIRGYQWGLRNPFTGATGNGNMSYDEDSASVHLMGTLGIVVYDPTQVVSFIPSILQG